MILYTSGSQKDLIFLIFMKNHDFYHFSRLLSGLEVPDRAHIAPGSVLKPLQNDSPQQGDELKKNPIEKHYFFLVEKYFQKKLLFFFDFQIFEKINIFEKIKLFVFSKMLFFFSKI